MVVVVVGVMIVVVMVYHKIYIVPCCPPGRPDDWPGLAWIGFDCFVMSLIIWSRMH